MSSDDSAPSTPPGTIQTTPSNKEPSLSQKNDPHLFLRSIPDRIVEEEEEDEVEEEPHPPQYPSSSLSHQQQTVGTQEDSMEPPFSPEQEATGEGKSALHLSSKKQSVPQEDMCVEEEQSPPPQEQHHSEEPLQFPTQNHARSSLVDPSQEIIQPESLGQASGSSVPNVAAGELDAVDGLADGAELQTYHVTDTQQQHREVPTILPFHPQNGREETTGERKVISAEEPSVEVYSLPGPSQSEVTLKEEDAKSEQPTDESVKDNVHLARENGSPCEAVGRQPTPEHDIATYGNEGPQYDPPTTTAPEIVSEEVSTSKASEQRVWSKTSSKEDDEEEDEEDELVSFATMGNQRATSFISMAEEEVSDTRICRPAPCHNKLHVIC